MIWSLIKIITFIIVISIVTFAAGAIIDAGGIITMQFSIYEISLTPIQGIIFITLFMAILLTGQMAFGNNRCCNKIL